jgi:hypothetical protein
MDSNFGIPTKGSLKTRRPGDICQKMESGFFHGFLAPVSKVTIRAYACRTVEGLNNEANLRDIGDHGWGHGRRRVPCATAGFRRSVGESA